MECNHEVSEIDNEGISVCVHCHIEKVLSATVVDFNSTDWHQNKDGANQSRYKYKSYNASSTDDDLMKLMKAYDSDQRLVDVVFTLYRSVVKGDTIRHPFNKSVLFMCAHTIYKTQESKYLEMTKLQRHFGLTRKQILNGIKYFNMKVSLNHIKIDVHTSISVEDYIRSICADLDLPFFQDLIDIYNDVITRNNSINHASPKSIAVSILRNYARKNNMEKITTAMLSSRYVVSDTSMSKIDKIIG